MLARGQRAFPGRRVDFILACRTAETALIVQLWLFYKSYIVLISR
jgi:hypothetical protein